MADAINGEVVEPETIYLCHAGEEQLARAAMDRRGWYGGVVRASQFVASGQVVRMDGKLRREEFDRNVIAGWRWA